MTVAIISEYNPFHTGHEYQIKAIREEFGADTEIVAVMSGNFTQRGEVAVADKYLRAKWAVLSGVNLVIELPFPYSMSSAEIFARAAVKIIDSLGVIDCISFGSESGDIKALEKIAENMQKSEYSTAFSMLSSDSETKNLGYPALSELAYKKAFGSDAPFFKDSNDILAIEYIKSIKTLNSSLKLHTVKRYGAPYISKEFTPDAHQSAMSIRAALAANDMSFINSIPEEARDSFLENLSKNEFPCDESKLSSALITHFRINPRDDGKLIFDARGGLYNRLKKASIEATDIETLISNAETKKFTNARIRRAIWYSFFGVTSSDVKDLPRFSQVLALDTKGRALLKAIKRKSDFPLITKPSAVDSLDFCALEQKKRLDVADSVFQLTKPKAVSGKDALRRTPFVKK